VGADITYDPVLIKDVCAALLVMMKALGRPIDVFITATVRTQVLQPPPRHATPPLVRSTLCTVCVPGAYGVRRTVWF
jgi:hypothetical protein